MIECALFGYLRDIESLCRYLRLYRRKDANVFETLYSYESQIVVVREEKEGVYLIHRDTPDRSKTRNSICSEMRRAKIMTPDVQEEFLISAGFRKVRKNKVEEIVFERHGITIEISRCISSDVEECVDVNYLVKVFVISENIADGEKILADVMEDLEGQVQLLKPSLRVFG